MSCRRCETTVLRPKPRAIRPINLASPKRAAHLLGISERVVREARDDHASASFIAAILEYFGGDLRTYFDPHTRTGEPT